jgi:hypothetical protein
MLTCRPSIVRVMSVVTDLRSCDSSVAEPVCVLGGVTDMRTAVGTKIDHRPEVRVLYAHHRSAGNIDGRGSMCRSLGQC